ncbi:unnamed protein product [Rotaria socialis]|uniref:F-box domain-containing protein n=1 Tax=Rotaria socialis TaxID=392032 RepID=A0A819XTX3_9BILA|nr:unnamed protein product [Rotaria socialis]CAF3450653.1 unnamed protein product [Rotaria socialis]CAF3528624.1 unnamed protein product [Rotaria socialis]CAF4146896.1 unnamed protein product [Rotaria socialis]CAF4507633.1 unnamed protein product [Rotaria socialis]
MNKASEIPTKFESLPNEILLEYFMYFNACQLFYSFDRLNYRLSHLIRNSTLHVDFSHVRKSIFDRFCKIILKDPQTKDRIYSLHLSNENSHGLIQKFFSSFSTTEFPHLQSLKLTIVDDETIQKLNSIISSMKELSSLHLNCTGASTHDILSSLTTSKLKTLSATSLNRFPLHIDARFSITNLTICCYDLHHVCHLLANLPQLNYLNVKRSSGSQESNHYMGLNENFCAVNLIAMVIDDFQYGFNEIEDLFNGLPNLKSLTICSADRPTMINARQWERLITSSLPHLETFRFRFICDLWSTDDEILELFQQFQSDFWLKTHHWYTEYLSTGSDKWICTIPCPSYRCDLTAYCDAHNCTMFSRAANQSLDSMSSERVLQKKREFHFCDIVSLDIMNAETTTKHSLGINHIKIIKDTVNLSELCHLFILSDCKLASASVLLRILKATPKLSSIQIDSSALLPLLVDDQLCKYLNRMIKRLDLYMSGYSPTQIFRDPTELKRFSKAFSNIEVLHCNTNQKTEFKYLLDNLQKLISLTTLIKTIETRQTISEWLEKELAKQNANYDIKYEERNRTCLVTVKVWMG